MTGEEGRAVEGFLAAVKTLSQTNNDPEFYALAEKALAEESGPRIGFPPPK